MKDFFNLKGSDDRSGAAFFQVEEVLSDELRYLVFRPLNCYLFNGDKDKEVGIVVLNRDGSTFWPRFLPDVGKGKELEGKKIAVPAQASSYHDYYDGKEHVLVTDKYAVGGDKK